MSKYLGLKELIKKITEITQSTEFAALQTLGEDVYIELVADGPKHTPIKSGVTDLKIIDKHTTDHHASRLFVWPTTADDSPILEGVGKSGLEILK